MSNFENEKIFLCLKVTEIDMGGGGQFWVEKNESGHKNSFFLKLNPFSGGKYLDFMARPLFRGKFCDVISPKLEKLPDSKVCVRHAFIAILTHAKFHFNRLMVTLIFGIRASEPPSPPPDLAND